jgi:hypothetical protein
MVKLLFAGPVVLALKYDGLRLLILSGSPFFLGPQGWRRGQDAVFTIDVGGLSGIVADLRLPRGWSKSCSYSNGLPVQPLITGLGVSGLDHNVIPGSVTRLYLLNYLQGALAIEVVDIKDAHHLPAYSQLVEKLRFGT